ncbi:MULTISPECIES: phasin family protein [Clostridium]|uniref:phasin family protein n=1 Tax=Clostridium TaxID=1485 RepID=UPI001CCC8827|nr:MULTISPECIES: phasin family protein [Clostridium]KAI3345307.1 phasin family protein [Clostridium botulinum]KAI3349595.1 phasin family protein [Clostridium botulinum]MBZ9689963.1 phasin family protein [Clostridium sp. M14]MCR1131942.1 phasin family protein [Clostridium botulinum]
MIFLIKEARNLFIAMVGATTMTYEKANEVVNTLVEKGKVTIEEGKELSEELKREIKEKKDTVKFMANEKINEIKPLTKDDIYGILQEFDFISKEEFNELKDRISDIEEKLKDK